MRKLVSILGILIGIFLFFFGLEILGIIVAVVALFFFPSASTTSTLDSQIDDDYYANRDDVKSEPSDSGDSSGGNDD